MAIALPASPSEAAAPISELAARARADGVRFLLARFVDLTGKPCAKLVPAEAADELRYDGVGFAGFAVGAIGAIPPRAPRGLRRLLYAPRHQQRRIRRGA